MNKNKQLVINLTAQIFGFAVNFLVGFFLSPFIVKNVGEEAYGFVSLGNNFVSYATLLSAALNSMAGRFVTIHYVNKDYKKTNSYFSSVFFANIFLSVVFIIPATLIVLFLEKIINVSDVLVTDVKLLWAFIFLNYLISIAGSVFSIATFATNKLYLSSIRTIISQFIRVAILVVCFSLFPKYIWFIGLASLVQNLYSTITNISYTKKLTPELKIQKSSFDIKKIKEIVSSGIWSTVNRLGQILLDGLDLLITNIFINSLSMGVLSISKTIPGTISSIVGSVAGVFAPNYTILYAENKTEELIKQIKQSMRIMGVLVNIPILVLIVCGREFYALWQPTMDAKQLYILSLLGISCVIISGGINCIYNIFTVVNKLKANSIVVIASGLLSALVVFILLKTTNLGIYAVAGVSTVFSILRNLFFTAPYGAKCLKMKWYALYPDIIRPVFYVAITTLISYFTISKFNADTWIMLVIKGIMIVALSLIIGYFVFLGKDERARVNSVIKNKIKR